MFPNQTFLDQGIEKIPAKYKPRRFFSKTMA
jgi:hypothetical protein